MTKKIKMVGSVCLGMSSVCFLIHIVCLVKFFLMLTNGTKAGQESNRGLIDHFSFFHNNCLSIPCLKLTIMLWEKGTN